jgi:PAS domain S-box-containing protein
MQANETKVTIPGPQPLNSYQPPSRRKAFWAGIGLIAVVGVAAIIWVGWSLRGREAEFEENLQKRLELVSAAQVQLIEAQFATTIEEANRVINSELYRLYAAEVDMIEDDVALLVSGPLPGQEVGGDLAQLSEQLPMMQSLLIEFTRITGYLGARVVNRNGTVFIATDAATTPLRSDQMTMVKQALSAQQPLFGPLRATEQGLLLEAFLPIFPPEASGLRQTPVAVLILSKVIGERLKELSRNRLLEQGERVRLLQKVAEGYQEVVPWVPGQLQTIKSELPLDSQQRLPFAVRAALGGGTRVYSVGVPIAGPEWWVVTEADYDAVREHLSTQQKAVMSIATLLIVVFAVGFGAFWALLVGAQERKAARHFEQLAREIEQQRQLLDRINSTISDYLVLKDLRGRYLYVNPSFAEAVGRSSEELVGLDNEAVFGYDTARRLEHSDQQVLASGEPVTFSEQLYLQSQPHHLQISKSALKDADGKPIGIVSVIRDVTELVEVQQRQQQATTKTVEALVRAIELTDPYLAGHSRLMGALGVEVAKAMNASDLETATVETAANLSQVGKLFVRRELLFKAETLSAEEKFEMEGHVEHAAKVLEGIDFGLPVFEAVYQMNENLDGSGYPQGLTDGDIVLPARVLAVVNRFCAMVEPRAYRGARPLDDALMILETADGLYDQTIVSALKEVVKSAAGEKLLARKG